VSGQIGQLVGHGDLGVTGTMAGGGSAPGIGAGVGLQGSNADQIKDLNGPFCTAGTSGGVGAELPFPAEVHGGVSDTWSASFSIPKAWHWLTTLFD
jgi:hypothetical protein